MIARRLGAALASAAIAGLVTSGAQAHCASPKEQSAFDVGALKSELSVLAVGCGEDNAYNAFVNRDRSELVAEDAIVNAWYKRMYGKAAQSHYDQFITTLANEQSIAGQHEGSEFCPRLKALFTEVMAVPVANLPQYAAAKNLTALDLACVEDKAPASVTKGKAARKKKA